MQDAVVLRYVRDMLNRAELLGVLARTSVSSRAGVKELPAVRLGVGRG